MTSRIFASLFVVLASTSFGLFTGCGSGGEPLRATGSSCARDSQCTSQSCTGHADSACGVCVDVRGLGKPCGGPLERCSDSATCTAGVCKSSMKTLDEPCSLGTGIGKSLPPQECDDELYCAADRPVRGLATCAPRGVLGGACERGIGCALGAQCQDGECVVANVGTEGDSCDGRACAAGLFCGAGICRTATLPIGANCGGPDRDLNDCAPGGSCQHTGGPLIGNFYPVACFAMAKEGEPCAYNPCGEGLFCGEAERTHERMCQRQRLRPVGQTCGGGDVCAAGLECRAGVCAEAC
jgi:hypothetical protein